MNHKSPLMDVPDLSVTYPEHFGKNVNLDESLKDLLSRCSECRKRAKLEKR